MNVVRPVEQWAAQRPAAAALVSGRQVVSFGELDAAACRLANGLAGLGIRDGDRVAIMLSNTPEFVYTFYACQKLGAVAVPFNTMYKSREVLEILRDSGARAIVCQTNFVNLINEVRPELPALEHVITTGERTLTFADPQSTMFVQGVLSADLFASLDEAYRRIGAAMLEGLHRLGVSRARYHHMGALRVDGRRIGGFVLSESKGMYVVNGICFVDRFDPADFFNAIWVPPEVKDKILEPMASVAEQAGRVPSAEEFAAAMSAALEQLRGDKLEPGTMNWLERLLRSLRRRKLLKAAKRP